MYLEIAIVMLRTLINGLLAMSELAIVCPVRAAEAAGRQGQQGGGDNIIGVLTTRDILAPALMNEAFDLRALLREAPIVRDGQSALEVVGRLRTLPAQMLLAYDEYGHFEEIITPMDVFEAIAGEFPDSAADEPKVVTRPDGTYLIAGMMPVDEVADVLSLEIDEDRDYATVAGLVLEKVEHSQEVGHAQEVGHLQKVGHSQEVGQGSELQGWALEVVDPDGRRINRLLVDRTVSLERTAADAFKGRSGKVAGARDCT